MKRKLFLGEFFGEIIEKHKKDLDPQHPKDFIDVYLLEAEKNGEVVLKSPAKSHQADAAALS